MQAVLRALRVLRGSIVVLLAGCGLKRPPAEIAVPEAAATVKTPPLLHPGARTSRVSLAGGGWEMRFRDDLCREFVLEAVPDTAPTRPLEDRVRLQLVPALVRAGADEPTAVRAEQLDGIGEAVLVRYRHQRAGPCDVRSVEAGGHRSLDRPDAEAAAYYFRRDGRLHRALYLYAPVAPGNEMFGIKVLPVEAVLREFVAGVRFGL